MDENSALFIVKETSLGKDLDWKLVVNREGSTVSLHE